MFDLNNLWPTLILCCVIPFVVILVGSLFLIFRGMKILMPSEEELSRRFADLRAQSPHANAEQLIRQIIHRQALRAGFVGALTSVGGLPVLPLGLTVDIFWTARIQNVTLQFIAKAYGLEGEEKTLNFTQALALNSTTVRQFALERMPGFSQSVTRRLIVFITEKTFAKLIPGLGFFIGFGVNYLIARGISELAAQWYSGNLDKLQTRASE
jgi:hypothetical protein